METASGTVDGRGVGAQPPRGWLLRLIGPLKIQTKERGLQRIDRVIKRDQLDFVNEVERQIVELGRVRICTLKARQIGISTIIEAIIFTFTVLLRAFAGLILAHKNDSSEHLLSMTLNYWETYHSRQFFTEKYRGKKILSFVENNSALRVGTAGTSTTGRSNTLHALHASEVAFWNDPDTLMAGLQQAIPDFGLTFIFLESTANGMGNYFHTVCMQAMRGENEYVFKFYPWWRDPEYTARYLPSTVQADAKYMRPISVEDAKEEDHLRRVYKVTEEQLIWRRYTIINKCNGSIDTFHQEYPASPHEAFVSTGRNVFPINELIRHYEPRKGKVGVLQRNDATRRVEFIERSDGWLTVYSHPSKDREWGVYLVGADPTHTMVGDNAVGQVINRRTGEQVAVYRNKIDPINFGKHLQMLGTYYHNALVAPENEGPGYATVGCMVADNYLNMYQGSDDTTAQGHPSNKYGWSTNSKTKKKAIAHLLKQITDPVIDGFGLVVHDPLTMLELRNYVTTDSGLGFENADGSEYDDGVMALAIAVTVDDLEPPPPAYRAPSPHAPPRRTTIETMRDKAGGPVDLRVKLAELQPAVDVDDDDGPPPAPAWEAWRATPRDPYD